MSTTKSKPKKRRKRTGRPKRPLMAIHRNIKALREKLGLTPGELGALADGDKTHVWHWENGNSKPNDQRLPLVAKALGVTVGDLFSESV